MHADTPTPAPARSRPSLAGGTLLLALLLGAGCGSEAPPALEVGPVAYDRDALLGLPDDRKLLLGELAAFGLAVAEGEAEALAAPLAARAERRFLARALQASRQLDSAGVGDDVLRARYRTDPALELTVRHLIVLSERYETDAQRAEARAKAERALERIRDGEPFPDVAAEVSEEPGAEGREGLLQPGRRGAWVDEFWNAAEALDPGEISGVVETQYGFHVLRLEAKDTVPFEETRARVMVEVAELMGGVEGEAPPPDGLELSAEAIARVGDAGAPDSLVVARWDAGTLTLGELRAAAATLERGAWERVRSSGSEAEELAREEARLRAAAARAREQELRPPPAVAAEAERRWAEAVLRWSAGLSFAEGMSAEAVRVAALEALGATGQNAVVARQELRERAPLLHHRYDIRLREPQG